ncbi:class I SAM-dependent methyltransferase [Candidatus Leptofilum sp.]|uniref:class I SAM-dependent methyltransferase n=1 Tax=Candidatus Leptofilum sp. TaxID=3241576 RepID=UPI003B5CAACB
MTLDDLAFLLSDEGQRWLADVGQMEISPQTHLQIASWLRQKLPRTQAQAVLETVVLRQHAVAKFSRAAEMYFVRAALEQASAEMVAQHRARRFANLGCAQIADLGCGIGGDAIALAAIAEVTGVEWEPVRLAMAQENVRVYGYGDQFHPLQADLHNLTPLADMDAFFFDPARRDGQGRRFFSLAQYRPPLSLIDAWRKVVPDTAVKISPGVNYTELPDDAEVEFVSLGGEMKEGVLWYGHFHSGVSRRATLLPDGHTLTTADLPSEPIPSTEPKAYLYEPDGAVIRAHLVQAVAAQLGANQVDDSIAYLTGETAVATPFARCFAIEDWFPFQLKQLRYYLRERQVGSVTIKKRGSPLEPDKLQRQLRLSGPKENHRFLFLTHVLGEPSVIVATEEMKA